MKKSTRKQKAYIPVVRIDWGENRDTGFYEFSVFESDKPISEEPYPDRRDEKYFLIRPSPSKRLIVMIYDRNADPSHVPQLQPEIIMDYINPYHAKRRLEKETLAYSRELMKKWGQN
ncbi:MAG: hypothetical protein ABIH28_01815 [archaeon]